MVIFGDRNVMNHYVTDMLGDFKAVIVIKCWHATENKAAKWHIFATVALSHGSIT